MISLSIGRMVNSDGVKGLVRKRPEVAQRVLPQRVHLRRVTLWFIRSNLEHTLPLVLAASVPWWCGSLQPTLFCACWQGCFCAPETAQPKHGRGERSALHPQSASLSCVSSKQPIGHLHLPFEIAVFRFKFLDALPQCSDHPIL